MSLFWVGFASAFAFGGFLSAVVHTTKEGEERADYSYKWALGELLWAFVWLVFANLLYLGVIF